MSAKKPRVKAGTSKAAAIYALQDAEGVVRYVGKSVRPGARFTQHCANARKKGGTPLYRWLRGELAAQRAVSWRVLEWVSPDQWEDAERRLIAEHRRSGLLLNLAEGGNAPKNAEAISPQRARIAQIKRDLARAVKDNTLSDEVRLTLAEKMRLAAARNPEMFGKWASL